MPSELPRRSVCAIAKMYSLTGRAVARRATGSEIVDCQQQ
jgi:hypothetical protein